jgi:hypothetical protein
MLLGLIEYQSLPILLLSKTLMYLCAIDKHTVRRYSESSFGNLERLEKGKGFLGGLIPTLRHTRVSDVPVC